MPSSVIIWTVRWILLSPEPESSMIDLYPPIHMEVRRVFLSRDSLRSLARLPLAALAAAPRQLTSAWRGTPPAALWTPVSAPALERQRSLLDPNTTIWLM